MYFLVVLCVQPLGKLHTHVTFGGWGNVGGMPKRKS